MFNPENYVPPSYEMKNVGFDTNGKPMVRPYLTDDNYFKVMEIWKEMMEDQENV